MEVSQEEPGHNGVSPNASNVAGPALGPPTKKQKLRETVFEAAVEQTMNNVSENIDTVSQPLISDNRRVPGDSREVAAGILCYVDEEHPGFCGTLKHRYV
jgi:hypothetical protein